MPHIDGRSGDIVVRIVYDGAPEAGKTTNVQQLFELIPLQRRGALASPGTTQRRTEFFDWLDFAGGFVDGRRLRCQLVSVPGQSQLLHRRKYLLETADAIVFVADSRPEQAEGNRDSLRVLRRILDGFAAAVPVGIVLQANKQDLPAALPPAALLSALELPDGLPVVAGVATWGRGVLDTFVLAARLATDRVRALLREGRELQELVEREGNATALHAAMVAAEKPASAPPVSPAANAPPPPPLERVPLLRLRANDLTRAHAARFPRPESLLAGHVWPPVRGRASLVAAMADGTVATPTRVLDWAPPAPIELAFEGGWVLHSSSRWLFESDADARVGLRGAVRQLLAAPELVPEGRAVFLGPDDAGYRLWMLTPALPSIAEMLIEALAAVDREAVAAALAAAKRATVMLKALRGSVLVQAGAAGVGMQDGRVTLLAGIEAEEVVVHAGPPAEDALTLAERAASRTGQGEEPGPEIAAVAPDEHALALAERAAAGHDERVACIAAALRTREIGGGGHGS
jgi:signal recognition particle receptor subunit beta